jgi:hypothetical protein
MKGKDAPSKWTLLRVNSSIEQIEKRRQDLEEWLWALLKDSELSRSFELAAFLELQAAAAGNQARRCGTVAAASHGHQHRGSARFV